MVLPGFNPGTQRLQDRHSNHSATVTLHSLIHHATKIQQAGETTMTLCLTVCLYNMLVCTQISWMTNIFCIISVHTSTLSTMFLWLEPSATSNELSTQPQTLGFFILHKNKKKKTSVQASMIELSVVWEHHNSTQARKQAILTTHKHINWLQWLEFHSSQIKELL